MRKIVVGAVLVVLASWVVFPGLGFTTPDNAKKEGNKPCTTCHEAGKFNKEGLNAVGKCYAEKKDWKACEGAK